MNPGPRAPRSARGRFVVCALALGALAAPACGSGLEPASKIEGLRVVAVAADKPYAAPGDAVTFKMTYDDGPAGKGKRPIQITWLGGCVDPIGDQYYGCYQSFQDLFQSIQSGMLPPPGTIAQGVDLDTFTTTLPKDIISRRPAPQSGPHYGIEYVFFAACAGKIRPIAPEGTGKAGSFPLACFDEQGNRLGADSFVPGYTQIYSFEDGRPPNTNPPITSVTADGGDTDDDPQKPIDASLCSVAEETRQEPPSCSRKDPFKECTEITFDVKVPADVAEIDPDGKDENGNALREAVWVDYYADAGDFDSDLRLVVDPTTGETKDHSTKWIAPPDAGTVNLWVVLHDARGGVTVAHRTIVVK